jgi:hypothetical protein
MALEQSGKMPIQGDYKATPEGEIARVKRILKRYEE